MFKGILLKSAFAASGFISPAYSLSAVATNQWIEAENVPSAPIKFAKDINASNGMVTWGSRWYRLATVPLPQNKREVYVYINAKTEDNKNQYFQLSSKERNYPKTPLPEVGKWCWAKLGPIRYNGREISIRPNGKPGINSYLDGYVISNNSNLSHDQLEKIKHSKSNGRISIGRCAKKPIIDGKLDDACWRQTVKISPFALNKSAELAREQTVAMLTYDEQYIYAGFRCYSNALEPAQNRLHEFIDKVKQHDSSGIYKDDCVILLFSPEPDLCYELTANANGAILDARGKSPDFWKNREIKWDSGAIAKGLRQNGFWTVEIAIPRRSLKTVAPYNCKLMLGRINQAFKENSAFSRISHGFHDPSSFCALTFRQSVPSLEITEFPKITAGRNNLIIELKNQQEGTLIIEQLVNNHGFPPKLITKEASLVSGKKINAPMEIQGGKLNYMLTIRDGLTSDILLQSPQYAFNPTVSVINSKINSPGIYQYFVNGKLNNQQLSNGLNVIALKAPAGTSAEFSIGTNKYILDSSWKYSAAETKGWQTADCDQATWHNAEVKDGILQRGGYLRKIILIKETDLWPNWQQYGVNICRGASQQFFFPPRGIKGVKKTIGYKLNIELPDGFQLSGASSYYNLFKTPVSQLGTSKRNGIKYKRYQISLPKNMRYREQLPQTHEYCVFAVRAPRQLKADAYMYYYAEANDSNIVEVPQKLKINLLPALNGRQPKKIIFQLWVKWLRRMSNPRLQKEIVKDCINAGFNEMEKLNNPTPGIKNFKTISFASYNLKFTHFLERHPDMALIDSKGVKSRTLVCPEILLNDPDGKKYFQQTVNQWQDKHQEKHVVWDYEYDTFDAAISCFCPRCLKSFGHGSLQPAEIRQKYFTQWIVFMNKRMAAITGRFNQLLNQKNPAITFSVYSGYQSKRTMKRYGVDWSMLKGKIQTAICGYGRPEAELQATYTAIGKTNLILGAIVHPSKNTNRSYPTHCSEAKIIRRLLDSKGGGVLIYSLTGLDGRTFFAMSQISSLVAKYEDFFIENKRVDTTVKCNIEYAVLELHDQRLLILLNQQNKMLKFHVDLSKPHSISDYFDNRQMNTENISGTINPGQVKAYLVR